MPSNSSAPISKILVPVANPATARDLLRLSGAFLDNDKSKVIALLILSGELDEETELLATLESIVEQVCDEGVPAELQTHKATSVARGILDVARDTGVDLIVLGLRQHAHRQVVLGGIAENVLVAAPCDVVVYRPARNSDVKRVVIAVDGRQPPTRRASYLGVCLAEHYQVSIEAMHVLDDFRPRWEGMGKLEQSLEGIGRSERIQRTLIDARDAAEGIVSELKHTDLLIVAYARRSGLERWLSVDFSRRILNLAPCPVLLTAETPSDSSPWLRRTLSRFSLLLTPAEQDDMMRQAYQLSTSNLDYLVLILISAMLASLGLLLNNAAVVIGAMLVAPFMQPCIAYALGIASGRYRLAARAFLTLLSGVVLAFIVALVSGLLLPDRLPTPQLLARGNPVFLDAWVAVGAGAVGAYATARKEIPTALAGVAVAAALMPPLAAFGLQVASRQFTLALHAGLLFFTNIVCISLAAWFVFAWLGVRPHFQRKIERWYYWPIAISTVAMLCLVVFLISTTREVNQSEIVRSSLEDFFPEARIVDIYLQDKDNDQILEIYTTLSTPRPITPIEVQEMEDKLSSELGATVRLEVALQPIVTAPDEE